MDYNLKGVQVYKTMSQETTAFTADLYLGRVKLATVNNDGGGGCNIYRFKDKVQEQEFYKYCKGLPAVETPYGPLKMSADLYIGRLLDEWEEKRLVKHWTKKGYILFRLDTDPEEEFQLLSVKGRDVKQERERLEVEYKGRIEKLFTP